MEGSANYKPNRFTCNSLHAVKCNLGGFSFMKKEIPNYMSTYFFQWIKMWQWYKKGYMPYSKSWYEHPWKIIKVFEIFDAIENEQRNER